MTFWERIGYAEYQHQQNTWKCKIPECKQTNGKNRDNTTHIKKTYKILHTNSGKNKMSILRKKKLLKSGTTPHPRKTKTRKNGSHANAH